MKLKPRRLPKKSKRIHKAQTQQLSNIRRIVLNEAKNELEVDQNIISYRDLDIVTQRIFKNALKQCIETGCIHHIFTYPRNARSKPQSIAILDSDANHLIWKMLRLLSTHECNHKLANLTLRLSQKEVQIQEYTKMKSKLNQEIVMLQKNYDGLQDNLKQQMLDLVKKISSQITNLKLQEQKAIMKKESLKQKISLYKASIQIGSKYNKLLSYYLDKAIRQMIRQLICQSIIGIVEIPLQKDRKCLPECQQVYVVFQQSYPTAKIKFKDIIRIIGTSQYLKKCQRLSKCISKPEQNRHSIVETLTMCHICREVLDASELIFCANNISKREIKPYCSFDIHLYRQNNIQSDYFSQPKATATMPFFLYNNDQKGQPCCNRAFCKKCFKKCDSSEGQFTCPFCYGNCNCYRCENGIKLVKLIAKDLEFDPQMQKNYHNILNIFDQKSSKYCTSKRLALRTQKDRAEFYLLFPFLIRRLVAHTSIDQNKNSSGSGKLKYVRWSRHLQERFSNFTSPGDLLDGDQQSSSVDSRFLDPRYKYFEQWRNI